MKGSKGWLFLLTVDAFAAAGKLPALPPPGFQPAAYHALTLISLLKVFC